MRTKDEDYRAQRSPPPTDEGDSDDMTGNPDQGVDARAEAVKPASRKLRPAAQRALAEAESRRAKASLATPRELHGREGLDPVRYGDWEVKGIASDF